MNLEDEQLKSALATLLPRDRRIMRVRFEDKTFDKIGVAFGYSRAQAFRLTQIAPQKLNAKLKVGAKAGCEGI
jgi:DNA-directed RNA polymerase specialized sigma subunit